MLFNYPFTDNHLYHEEICSKRQWALKETRARKMWEILCFRRLWYQLVNKTVSAYVGSNLRALVLLTFIPGDVNRRQYHKIYSLKFDEIWQKYRTSVNESLKIIKSWLMEFCDKIKFLISLKIFKTKVKGFVTIWLRCF